MKCVPDILYDPAQRRAFDLYLPVALTAQSCVVYVYDGEGPSGPDSDDNALKLADRLTENGIALAATGHRFDVGVNPPLDTEMIEGLASRAAEAGLTLSPEARGPVLFAVVQDLSHLVEYLWVEGSSLGIEQRHVGLLGTGLGGVAALTLAYPPQELVQGLSKPDAVVGISSTFAQPWNLHEEGPGCLLFNAEDDPLVPIKDARYAMKMALEHTAPVTQIELGRTGSHRPFDVVMRAADGTGTAYFERVLRTLRP